MDLQSYELTIKIEMVKSGYVLTYPVVISSVIDGSENVFNKKEVFVSKNKMKKKISEVLDSFKVAEEV